MAPLTMVVLVAANAHCDEAHHTTYNGQQREKEQMRARVAEVVWAVTDMTAGTGVQVTQR